MSNMMPDSKAADMMKKKQEPVNEKIITMKAAVIHGPGKVTCDTVDDPTIKR